MKKMTTCLWFDGNAEDAARFYTSIFKGSKILEKMLQGKVTAKSERVMKALLTMKKLDIAALKRL